jgi:hypothetical protein
MYVKVTNGVVEKYPYSIGDLRKDNINTSFPANPSNEMLAEWGVYPVTDTPEPSYDIATQRVVWGTPALIDGQWTHTWDTVALSSEEQQSIRQAKENNVRNERNRLLVESDWTQILDAPVDRTAWAAYRQALRDITGQEGFPWAVQWPTKPE